MTACPSPTPKLEFSHRKMRAPKEEKGEKWEERDREREVFIGFYVSANTNKNWLGIGLAILKALGLTIDKYSQIEIVLCETKENNGNKCIYLYFKVVVLSIY